MSKRVKSIKDTLKAAIKASNLTHYAVGKLADVAPAQIDRFMSGERDLRLGTAAKLAAALGMELTRSTGVD